MNQSETCFNSTKVTNCPLSPSVYYALSVYSGPGFPVGDQQIEKFVTRSKNQSRLRPMTIDHMDVGDKYVEDKF